ncbi:MAG: hypothetical protein ABW098_17275 [Candidatus Thiodiazotropha sp.]
MLLLQRGQALSSQQADLHRSLATPMVSNDCCVQLLSSPKSANRLGVGLPRSIVLIDSSRKLRGHALFKR